MRKDGVQVREEEGKKRKGVAGRKGMGGRRMKGEKIGQQFITKLYHAHQQQ